MERVCFEERSFPLLFCMCSTGLCSGSMPLWSVQDARQAGEKKLKTYVLCKIPKSEKGLEIMREVVYN